MGIPGLTTFVNKRSDRYLEYYELHDTYLVIDGNSIGCQIYTLYAKCNSAFGGEYDKYAQCVSDFFDDLLKCNITPLVLIDGGCEDKKLQTIIRRAKDKIRVSSSCSPSNQRVQLFPLLNKDVLKDVMREKNIRHVQCLFEADNAIATVARILNCPVLSYDSDFYIYGTLYVPFDTLDNYIVKCPYGQGYMKRCKVYRVEYLLKSFRGLDQSMLPLAAILLGNDYVDQNTFKNFFRHLKLSRTSRTHNQQQSRIEATFIWLSKYTLDKAIIGILCRLPKTARQRVLNIIETNINVYTNASAQILVPLGFPKEYVARVTTHSVNRIFKFDGDVNNLTYIKETCDRGDCETNEEEDDDEDSEINIVKESEGFSNALVNNLPVWFVNDFLMARYPTYFMDLIVRRLYVCPVQVEDSYRPSSIVISLKIIAVIYGLLKSSISDQAVSMRYMIRGDCDKIERCTLDGTDTIFSCKLPALSNLREIPLAIRREILNDTLEIVQKQCVNELPLEWMLYVACAKYWIEQQKPHESRKCYVYAVLVCMLFNIIDSRIGKHRIMRNFQNKYGHLIETVQQKRKACNYNPCYSTTVELIEACNKIDADDCLLAASFFISHFEVDRKLYRNPKKFNRSIVHTFAELQTCLGHTMHLNALLGYPYPQIKVANLFNGILLYNLCNNFKTRHDIDEYIKTVFQNSPSLLRLFNILLLKVTPLFASSLRSGANSGRKPRTNCKRKKKSGGHKQEEDTDYFTADDSLNEPIFYDANNPFSLLNSTE